MYCDDSSVKTVDAKSVVVCPPSFAHPVLLADHEHCLTGPKGICSVLQACSIIDYNYLFIFPDHPIYPALL